MRQLTYNLSSWPLKKAFVISRGARTQTDVIQLLIEEDGVQGMGECLPYGRYGETIDSVLAQIESVKQAIIDGADNAAIQSLLPAGAARNAIDCALWDLNARQHGVTVGKLAGLGEADTLISAQTVSLDSPEKMAAEAATFARYPLLKLKLDGEQIIERLQAVRQAAPDCRLIIDANEAWSLAQLNQHHQQLQNLGIEMIEQPLPATEDQQLTHYQGTIPLCADESCHTSADVPSLVGRYQAINIKLDKTGGLTEAARTLRAGREHGLIVMVGCMLGTSLAMAPATLVAKHADYVDLDGPALLAEDVAHGFRFNLGQMSALNHKLWGN